MCIRDSREAARKDAFSQALIQLGAGIAGGDLSKGIAKAGDAVSKITGRAADLDRALKLSQLRGGPEREAKQLQREIDITKSQLEAAIWEDRLKDAEKLDPSSFIKEFTPESIQVFMDSGANDYSLLEPIVKEDSLWAKPVLNKFTPESIKIFTDQGGTDYSLLVPIIEGGKVTPKQREVASYAQQVIDANNTMEDLYSTEGFGIGVWQKVTGLGAVPRGWKEENLQVFNQAKKAFINSWLRRTSGAAITEGEMVEADAQFFPQFGEDPETIRKKTRNRLVVEAGLISESDSALGDLQVILNDLMEDTFESDLEKYKKTANALLGNGQ
mgnify:FL=1